MRRLPITELDGTCLAVLEAPKTNPKANRDRVTRE